MGNGADYHGGGMMMFDKMTGHSFQSLNNAGDLVFFRHPADSDV